MGQYTPVLLEAAWASEGEAKAPFDFENFSKKRCFHGFEWEKNKFHHF